MTNDEMNRLVFLEARKQQYEYGIPAGLPRVERVMNEFIETAQLALGCGNVGDFEEWIRCAEYAVQKWRALERLR